MLARAAKSRRSKWLWLLGALAVATIGTVVLLGDRLSEGLDYIHRQPPELQVAVDWEDRGPTPGDAELYKPQGLAWVDGRLLFSNHWHDTNTRVYLIEPSSMEVLGHFDMPEEAVHTSGLDWDGEFLWAVDYISNRGYKIRLAESLAQGRAVVEASFETGMKGTSAATLLTFRGETLLAISEHRFAASTVLIRHEEAAARGTLEGTVVLSYDNGGFSQGLTWDGTYLYEAENRRKGDVINRIDLELLAEHGSSAAATVAQYHGPYTAVEDLAWDGEFLWTSDEESYRFFRARLP